MDLKSFVKLAKVSAVVIVCGVTLGLVSKELFRAPAYAELANARVSVTQPIKTGTQQWTYYHQNQY